jgi:hypothetical protein
MTNSSHDQGIGKLCKICNLPPSETVVFGFHKFHVKDGISYKERSTCQSCEARLAKEYMAANKGKRSEAKKKHREKFYGTIKYHVQEKISTWRKASCVHSDLTVDYLIELYNRQDGYCYYSGEKMVFGWVDGKVHHNSLSLDKLDPAKGYVQDNVVWCTYLVNTMKQDMTDQEFYVYMNKILSYRAKSKS